MTARKKPGPKPGTGGRPSKYRPTMCKRVVDLMREGKSQAQVCAELDIGTTTLERWMVDHEDFRGAVTRATTLSEAEWEKIGQEMARGERQGNATVWIFNMKNRFGWRDQRDVELTGPNKGPVVFKSDWSPVIGSQSEDDIEDDDE